MEGIEPASEGTHPPTDACHGVNVAQAIRERNFEDVWALLVDGVATSPLPPAEEFPLPIHTGDHRVDMQAALAGLAPVWGFTSLTTTPASEARSALARASVMALSFLAQSARGPDIPAVQAWEINQVRGIVRRFLTRWQGQAPEEYARAINAAWIAVATDPGCPSIAVAQQTAATGADIAACLSAAVAACSGPLVSGGAAQIAELLRTAPQSHEARIFRQEWAMTPRTTPFDSPRVQALKDVAQEIGTDYQPVAQHAASLARYTHPRFSTEQILTTVWATHLFTFAGAQPRMLTAMFACGKTAGWSAAIASEHVRLLEKINR